MKIRSTLIAISICALSVSAKDADTVAEALIADKDQAVPAQTQKHFFSWGVDAGSAIDMTGHDMSAIDLNAYFGYRGPYVRFAGAGTGIDMMVSQSSTTYPLYAIFRTDFSPTPKLYFIELRGGVAFTKVETAPSQNTPFASLGIGVTLAKGRTFSSHIILSYNYTKLNDYTDPDGAVTPIHDMQAACIRIGINF